MFADDTNLTISGKNYFELQNGTNHDLASELSAPITILPTCYSPEIRLGDTFIKRVYSGKSHGVYIDELLSWSSHINQRKRSHLESGLETIKAIR